MVSACVESDRVRIEVEHLGRWMVLRLIVGTAGAAVQLGAVEARAVARGLLGGAALAEVEAREGRRSVDDLRPD